MYDKELLEKLDAIWQEYPHLRFGQLIDRIFTIAGSYPSGIFYVDDERVLDAREKYKNYIDDLKNF
jgi:hypothetical protein